MISFQNDPAKKEFYVQRMLQHAKADELVQGSAWEDGRGCFIGCTFHIYDHSKFETELGLPSWLARLSDRIFEGLSNKDAKWFAVEYYKRVPVGKDLDQIRLPMLIAIIESVVDKFNHKKYPKAKKKIDEVLVKLRNWPATAAATDAAYAAAAATAYATATATAATATAYDIGRRRNEASEKAYKMFAEKLFELMRAL